MSYAQQLQEAVEEDDGPIALMPGMKVEVRRQSDGDFIIAGFIETVVPATRTVRVRDRASGTDLGVDVDVDRYDIFVLDQDITGKAPFPRSTTLYLRPSKPGAFTGGASSIGGARAR